MGPGHYPYGALWALGSIFLGPTGPAQGPYVPRGQDSCRALLAPARAWVGPCTRRSRGLAEGLAGLAGEQNRNEVTNSLISQ